MSMKKIVVFVWLLVAFVTAGAAITMIVLPAIEAGARTDGTGGST